MNALIDFGSKRHHELVVSPWTPPSLFCFRLYKRVKELSLNLKAFDLLLSLLPRDELHLRRLPLLNSHDRQLLIDLTRRNQASPHYISPVNREKWYRKVQKENDLGAKQLESIAVFREHG